MGSLNVGCYAMRGLKVEKGKEYCIKCLLDTLKMNTETSYSILQAQFGLNPSEIEQALQNLLKNKLIEGQLNTTNKLFINLEATKQAQLVADLQTQGYIDIGEIERRFGINEEYAKKTMIDLIRKNNLKGTFTNKGDKYYVEAGINQKIIQLIKSKGKTAHKELAQQFDIHEGNIKKYIMNLLKNNLIAAYFGDNGNITYSAEFLESEIENYCLANGSFLISTLANQLKITPELTRKTLFGLIQKGQIRGIFTQNYEFVS